MTRTMKGIKVKTKTKLFHEDIRERITQVGDWLCFSSSHEPIFRNRVRTSSDPFLKISTPRAGSHTLPPARRTGRGSSGEIGGPTLDGEDAVSLENVREIDGGGRRGSSPLCCGVDGFCVGL